MRGRRRRDAADDFLNRTGAELGEQFADLVGNAFEIGHHHFRIAGKARAIFFILRGDARGTSVQVALARHHAADGEERSGAEAVFVGAEQRGDDDVAAGFESAVDAQSNAAAKTEQAEAYCARRGGRLPTEGRYS